MDMDIVEAVEAETTTFEQLRRFLFTRAPLKQIWLIGALAFNLIRIPFLFLYYLPVSTRPVASWTYEQAIRVRLFKAAVYNLAFTELSPALSLEPGKEGDRFVCMKPAAKELYQIEPLGVDDSVKPLVVGGTWYPRRPTTNEEVKLVVLHFHGMCNLLL